MSNEVIGIDAGGTWIKAGLFADDLQEIKRVKVASGAERGKEAYVASMAEAARELGGAEVVGLSLPGSFDKERTGVKYSPNVKGLVVGGEGLSLKEIGEKLRVAKIVSDNDAACAALGEWAYGECQADEKKYLLHLTWGTGIGVGLVVEGRPQYGWEGGHLPFEFDSGDQSWRLSPGADLEEQIAVPALLKQLKRLFEEKGEEGTRFVAQDFVDDKKLPILLSQYAAEGDELARRVVKQALSGMAWALSSMAVMAYPDVVTIGGAMMDRDWLLEELREQVSGQVKGILADSLKPEMVQRATLGNDAGMIGAARLARQRFFA